jgi:hypothetical protein
MAKADPQMPKPSVTPGTRKRPRATVSTRYLIPLATAILLGICFVVYYLTYVQQHREYLLNRNYRVLATLGEQMSETLANHTAILATYIKAFEGGEFYETMQRRGTYIRTHGSTKDEPSKPELLYRENNGPFQMSDQIRSFAPRLRHVLVRHLDEKDRPLTPDLFRRDGEWMFQLAAIDPDGDHEASATISVQALSQSFSPPILDTFDDVLIATEDGTIVFQKQRIGPHFSSLSDLFKSAAQTRAKQSGTDQDKNSKVDRAGASNGGLEQLVEMDLAGVPYTIFLEPVTIDLNPTHNQEEQQTHRFMLAGLVPSRRFRWQSLAISYRSVIFFSSIFLLLCLCTPLIKIVFLNERERLRMREIVLLPLLFVTIAGALTSICLQTIYFNLRHDDTDSELVNLSRQMQANIKGEIQAMRAQLIAACNEPDFQQDRGLPYQVIRKNVLKSEFLDSQSRPVAPYPYFNNLFWTDGKGRQKVKWSTTENVTPLIDVSTLEFFRNLNSDSHYLFLNEAEPFRLDSLLPPNQDNYVGVLGMRISDCAGPQTDEIQYAFISASPLSLIDPKLPLGFSFALVDEAGRVLFHSDKFRNNRENILVETSQDRELTASIYGHSNDRNFSLDYRGDEVRARVVSVPGVMQSSWSLIVYREAQYAQTYDLEVITMAGMLLFGYLAVPALIVCFFYFLARPNYVPDWLWPSESLSQIYRFQIAAGMVMLALSAALIFLRPIEESLYAAAAAGYVTLIIVLWSTLSGKPPSRGTTIFGWICWLFAVLMVVLPILEGWWSSVLIGLVLFPFALALRSRKHLMAHWPFPKFSSRSLYYIRVLVLLTVIGILPPLSFFRNSMLLEDNLHLRAAQLDAARAWNSRETTIGNSNKDVPGISGYLVGPDADGKPANRCRTLWDFYLGSYYGTQVNRQPHSLPKPPPDYLDPRFLSFAHFLHHSFNDIGADALGVLKNPALPKELPEDVYKAKSSQEPPVSKSGRSQGDLPEWGWEWGGEKDKHPLQLRLHQGADASNACAAPDEPGTIPKMDLVVSSERPSSGVSAASNIFTWLGATTVMGLLIWLVTRKIFLFDLGEPLSHSAEDLREVLKGAGSVLVLPASRNDWSPKLAGAYASRIDIRELATAPDWGEKFDETKLQAEGPVVVENFDWELGYPDFNRQRLILIDRLVAHSRKVIAVSAVDPSPFLIELYGSEAGGDGGRWAAVLGAFTRINLGHRSTWEIGEEIRKSAPSLWQECKVQPELHRVAEDLWHARNLPRPLEPEQVVSEVGERAAQYYYLEWRSCTQEECFLLTGLARDGMVNPKNTASLRQLLRRRLIVRDPQFRIMNESFRRFVLAQAGVSMREEWEAEAAGSGWGKVRGPFATVVVLVGLFLLATQQQFLQTSTGLLTAAGGCVAALLKLIGVVRGRVSDA